MRSEETDRFLKDLDEDLKTNYKDKTPDCFVVYKLDEYNKVIDEPLAIFKKKESLFAKFKNIVIDNPDYGINVGFWWFDD